jgi:hypothetical protein
MHSLVLTPETVVARWSSASLVLHASGHEGGVTDVHISPRPNHEGPPEFEVTGRMSPFAGLFPYGVTCQFALEERPDEVVIVTKEGTRKVPVT